MRYEVGLYAYGRCFTRTRMVVIYGMAAVELQPNEGLFGVAHLPRWRGLGGWIISVLSV